MRAAGQPAVPVRDRGIAVKVMFTVTLVIIGVGLAYMLAIGMLGR